jgi:transcriptional regulator with XRE-family HTH domain
MDVDVTEARQPDLPEALDAIGERLREERERAGLSQRKLAKRLNLSPSLISQLESGQTKPSVGTLYSIVTELGVSLDSVIRGEQGPHTPHVVEDARSASPVVHPDGRKAIDLASGVRWEELTAESEEAIDFLHARYEVGGSSTPDESLMRHHGREYGYIVSGTLSIQIGFNEYTLEPGDSIAFDSERPHRLFNKGDEPVHAIWFVVGRDADARTRPD